jgi:flagellin
MALVINTNIASLEAQRNLAHSQTALATTFQKLSSGMRINTAADDASGLAISENMQAQIRSFGSAERNANNAVSMAQVAEGALGQMSNILSRMRELSVQGANGDLTATDRGYMNTEFTSLRDEIDRMVQSTKFNGKDLLSGPTVSIDFQVGINNTAADKIAVDFGNMTIQALGIASSGVDGADATNSLASISAVDAAIANVSARRADYGAVMNRLQLTVANTQSMRTNLSAANSRIRDVDVAEETASMARSQVLSQAGVSVLSQANQGPQLALKLLGGG